MKTISTTEAAMAMRNAVRAARVLEQEARCASDLAKDMEGISIALEHAHALLEEAAQAEGPLSADLRERMADAVSL